MSSKQLRREDLTDKQAEVLESGALLIINARNEAAEMLIRAGVERVRDYGWWGNQCGVPGCPCNNYTGDGCPCLTRTTHDPGAQPPHRVCGHKPSDHIPS